MNEWNQHETYRFWSNDWRNNAVQRHFAAWEIGQSRYTANCDTQISKNSVGYRVTKALRQRRDCRHDVDQRRFRFKLRCLHWKLLAEPNTWICWLDTTLNATDWNKPCTRRQKASARSKHCIRCNSTTQCEERRRVSLKRFSFID